MKNKYQNYNSFNGKIRVAFIFLAVIPYILIIYMFIEQKIELTEMMIYFLLPTLFSILTGFFIIRKSADELVKLAIETDKAKSIENFKLIQLNKDSNIEINDIADNFNSVFNKLNESNRYIREQSIQLLKYARDLNLSNQKIKEEERLRNKLSRYVGENLVEKLINSEGDEFFENEKKELTILFADIRSFTILAEKMLPEDLIHMLNEYFEVMVRKIFKNKGILDKFMGDQIVAVFGVVPSNTEAPMHAIQAAIEMQAATKELMKKRSNRGKETFEIGIGINTGHVVMGNLGSQNRMDYTVVGDTVNIAARLQQEAKGGEILIGEQVFNKTKGALKVKKMKQILVKNKNIPIACYVVDFC